MELKSDAESMTPPTNARLRDLVLVVILALFFCGTACRLYRGSDFAPAVSETAGLVSGVLLAWAWGAYRRRSQRDRDAFLLITILAPMSPLILSGGMQWTFSKSLFFSFTICAFLVLFWGLTWLIVERVEGRHQRKPTRPLRFEHPLYDADIDSENATRPGVLSEKSGHS